MKTTLTAFIAVLFAFAAQGCKPSDDTQSALRSDSDAQERTATPQDEVELTNDIFVAVGNVPKIKDGAESYRLLAVSKLDLDPASVKFCFVAKDKCATEQKLVIKAVPSTQSGRTLFTSNSYIVISNGVTVTVMAKTKDGTDVTQTVKLVTKGTGPAATAATGASGATGKTGDAAGAGTTNKPVTKADCQEALDDETCKVEMEVARLVNDKRKGEGLEALTYDKKMSVVSRLWSTEQMNQAVTDMTHTWLDDGTFGLKYQEKFPTETSPATLETSLKQPNQDSPELTAKAIVDAWWASADLKATLMSATVKLQSVGAAKDANGTWYVTQNMGVRTL